MDKCKKYADISINSNQWMCHIDNESINGKIKKILHFCNIFAKAFYKNVIFYRIKFNYYRKKRSWLKARISKNILLEIYNCF